ncbi:MAG: hypothetical protein PHI13_07445, partial [Methylococcales bacterium]|nr:hypothetical protein [Methylococcales bacterium]
VPFYALKMNKNPAQFGYIHSWKSPNHSIKQKMTSLIGVPGRLLNPTRFKMAWFSCRFLVISRQKRYRLMPRLPSEYRRLMMTVQHDMELRLLELTKELDQSAGYRAKKFNLSIHDS